MKFFRFILILAVIPLLIGCGREVPPLETSVVKKWSFNAINNSEGTAILATDSADFLTLTPNAFEYYVGAESNDTIRGTWSITDSTIQLTYDAPASIAPIDSAAFVVLDNAPSIIFYHEGNKVTTINNNEVTVDRQTSSLRIVSTNFNHLTLQQNNGTQYLLNYQPIVKDTSISWLSILRGLLGILTLLAIAWLFSANRKAISWSLVGKGLLIQIIFAICVLKVPFIESVFESISSFFLRVISFTQEGTNFLFSSFISGKIESSLVNFVVQVLPTIVFFSALTSLFYYWGILQKIVYGFAWIMKKVMKLSGAESLAAAGNIFLGQTESPLLVRPYLDKMTKSEMMCLMSGGMATIAGGVLAAYIGFLGGDDPMEQLFFAKHLLAASVMSAPAAVVAAKILVPETEEFNQELKVSKDKIGSNALEAIANGTTDGLKLAVNVAAMLLVFIALIAMGNYILKDMVGPNMDPNSIAGFFPMYNGITFNELILQFTSYDGLTFQFIIGYIFAPIAWMMGVASEDIVLVGQLLGEKTMLNEFVAYVSLGDMKAQGLFTEEKSIIMATYILCGFANFASIGIQIGGIGALVPSRKGLLSKLGMRALIGGTLACLFTAVIVGMLN